MSGPHCNCIDIPTVNIRGPSFHNIIMNFYDSLNNIASMAAFLHLHIFKSIETEMTYFFRNESPTRGSSYRWNFGALDLYLSHI